MPPGRKPSHSPEEFVEAAITFADEHGIAALTLRDLGRAMGMSATAVYRYFADKGALIVAMRETLLSRAFTEEPTGSAAEVIIRIGLAYRRVAREHPCLSQIMTIRVDSGETTVAVPVVIGEQLLALGLRGPQVALAYRQLESFVVGVTTFDFTNAPSHLDERLDRLMRTRPHDVAAGLTTPEDVDRLNEEAFAASLGTLVASLAALGSTKE